MPGKIYPEDKPRLTESHAEQDVYDALKKQLPDGYVAWHSLRLLAQRGVWEGEGDFVVLVPGRGLLVLEVKGGRIEEHNGHWFQNGSEMRKAPRDQAQSFARRLKDELKRRGLDVSFGIGCVFPDIEFSNEPSNADLRGTILSRRELRFVPEALKALVNRVLPPAAAPPAGALDAALTSMWGHTWVPTVVLRHRVEAASQRVLALDAQQLEILDVADGNSRALVEGAAGTGKTVVARELCRRRAAEGKRVLFVCYTEALALAIEQQFREMSLPVELVRAVAIRQYARELTGEDVPPPNPEPLEFWEQISARAVERIPAVEDLPDCVVLDEAQDLAAPDWSLIRALSKERSLWVFHDPRQSFWKERGIPDDVVAALPVKLKLKRQQRCPEAVARLADAFIEAVEVPTPDASIKLVQGDDSELVPRLTATLDGLIREGAKPEEIAVISLGGQKRTEILNLKRAGNHELVRCHDAAASRTVVADTFLRFKGLERPFIVIAGLEGGAGSKFGTRMHIALTRATVGVRILCTPAEIDSDVRLQALASV
jgi:hypothetical protein